MARLKLNWREKLADSKGRSQGLARDSRDVAEIRHGDHGDRRAPGSRRGDAQGSQGQGHHDQRDSGGARRATRRRFLLSDHRGIFAGIAARAAEEWELEGRKRVTPYWRTLKQGGEVNPKFPGGVEGQKERLEAEGHVVVQRGKRYFVEDYEKKLVKIDLDG